MYNQSIRVRKKEKEREKMGIPASMSVNDLLRSLPKIRKRRIWHVIIEGKVVQGVSASDNRKATAEAYISSKYPGQVFTLKFSHWKI